MIKRVIARLLGRAGGRIPSVPVDRKADAVAHDALLQAIESGDLETARRLESVLPADKAQIPAILVLRGRLALQMDDTATASRHLDLALEKRPELSDAHFWRAAAFMQQGLESKALYHALAVERLAPGNAEVRALIGVIKFNQKDLQGAVSAFESALAANSQNVNAHRNLATIYFKQHDWPRAAHHFRLYTEAAPGASFAWQGYASSLMEMGREEEAWPLYERALEVAETSADPYQEYAVALFNTGRIQEALCQIDSGLRLEPESAILHVARANCHLIINGDNPEGWAEYEWRKKLDQARYGVRTKLWPSAAKNCRLLVYAEQGIGDVILFARFISLVRHQVDELIVQIPPSLGRLMRSSAARFGWNVTHWVERELRIEPHEVAYDHEIPLLSLNQGCGFSAPPAAVPYLDVASELVQKWAAKLGERSANRLRIGLVWAGNPRRTDDAIRSIEPASLAPFQSVANADFISLQMDAKPQYKCYPMPLAIIDLTAEIRDFADTAAIMRNLDLVISIDTAAAHLAGALGVPCWVLLSKMPDWRWRMGGKEQPWYVGHRSFSVEKNRNWASLIERIATELSQPHIFEEYRARKNMPYAVAPSDLHVTADSSPVDRNEAREKISHAGMDGRYQQALALHQQGRATEAEAIYESILKDEPDHADTLHLLGVMRHQQGRDVEAVNLMGRAIELDARQATPHSNIGIALYALGRFDEALASYDRALSILPDFVEALHNRAMVLKALKRYEEALASYNRALILRPDFSAALNDRGIVLGLLGRSEEALTSYDQAIEARPDYAEAIFNRGTLLQDMGKHKEALTSYARALAVKPDYLQALNNHGSMLREMGRSHEALASFERALVIKPDSAEILNNRGSALLDMGRYTDALGSIESAIAIAPGFAEAHSNRGNVLQRLNRIPDALESYSRALSIRPDYAAAHSNKIFCLNYLPDVGFTDYQQEMRKWYETHGKAVAPLKPVLQRTVAAPKRLVVGYVSADFRKHSAATTFGPVFRNHDKSRFEVVCYSGVIAEDDMTKEFKRLSDRWYPVAGMPDSMLAKKIAGDGIDILVDLSGHSAGNRLLTFARKPVPIQITAWGYATGTGVPEIDYFFSDPIATPAAVRPLFAEKVYDLPCFITFAHPEYLPPITASPAVDRGFITFGCLNAFQKVSRSNLETWARILQTEPRSRLFMKDAAFDTSSNQSLVRKVMEQCGISQERIELRGGSSHRDHLAAYGNVDIALDPFPYNGGVTTWESLWMGVPVVSKLGNSSSGRSGGAILGALGLKEWVVSDEDEYVTLAIRKAQNINALTEFRRGIRSLISASRAGNPLTYTRAVEQAYEKIWNERNPGAIFSS